MTYMQLPPFTNNLILGAYRNDEQRRVPVVWRWSEHNALAVAGKGGSGKTTGTAFWLAQWAAQGVRFLLYDPHKSQKESLHAQTTQFLAPLQILPTADTVDEALEYIDFWWLLGLHRLRKQESAFPIVFVFDEFTSFVLSGGERTKRAIKRLLDSINQYRKVQMRVVLIGQTWGQALRAITSLRDSISSAVVFRSSYNDVRKFVPNDQLAKMSNQLATGTAITTIDYDRVIHVTRLNATDQLIAAQRASALSARYPVPLPFLRRNEQYVTLV